MKSPHKRATHPVWAIAHLGLISQAAGVLIGVVNRGLVVGHICVFATLRFARATLAHDERFLGLGFVERKHVVVVGVAEPHNIECIGHGRLGTDG